MLITMRAKHYGKSFPKHGGQTQHPISREFLTSLCAQAALVESVHKEMDLNTVRVLVDLYWIHPPLKASIQHCAGAALLDRTKQHMQTFNLSQRDQASTFPFLKIFTLS